MAKLVIFDSQYGNTEAIAKAMDKEAKKMNEVKMQEVEKAELLVIGSPTQGGRPTTAMTEFLEGLPNLAGKKVAVFDTRIDVKEQNFALKMLMNTIGYAAEKMGKFIENKGGKLAAKPEGFIVDGKEGPLRDKELDRAREWVEKIK